MKKSIKYKSTSFKTTTARRFSAEILGQLTQLKSLLAEANVSAWAIGDLVNELKRQGLQVSQQSELIGASRQRLSELRRTAAAFPPRTRRFSIDIHFYTVAMRSARRLGLSPVEVVSDLVKHKIDSTRAATSFLATRIREREALLSQGRAGLAHSQRGVWCRPYHGDCRNVLRKLPDGSVKLIIADPPYGRYAKYRDGQHSRISVAKRDCDALDDDSARAERRPVRSRGEGAYR